MLTIKILFTITSLKKKTISSKHYLQFLPLKKPLVLIRKKFISLNKNYSNWEHFISIKTIHFDWKKEETIFKVNRIVIIIVSSHGFRGPPTGSFPGTRWPPVTLGIHHLSHNSCRSQFWNKLFGLHTSVKSCFPFKIRQMESFAEYYKGTNDYYYYQLSLSLSLLLLLLLSLL